MKKIVLPSLPRIPLSILSDNGTEFTSKDTKEVMEDFGIKHSFTTPYRPSSNGLVERVNRTVLEMLRNLSSKGGSWIDDLPKAVVLYNNSYHSELRMSPSAYLLTTAHDVRPQPVLPNTEPEYWRHGNPSFGSFKVGQLVLRRVVFKGRQVGDKLAERFHGPYKVVLQQQNKVNL
jgi:transposase InsO family protein